MNINPFHNIGKTRRFHHLISKTSILLAASRSDTFETTVKHCLKLVGDMVKADRTYIFKYDFEANTCSNTFEHCAKNINPEIDNLQNCSLDGISDWVNTHQKGDSLYIADVTKLLKNNRVRQILEPQGVLSLLTLPLVSENKLYGFIGFDSVQTKHKYSFFERDILEKFSKVLMSAITRYELEHALDKEQIRLFFIVEAADLGIWEWNLETNEIKINDAWARFLGYTLEELKPHTIDLWRRLTHPDDLQISEAAVTDTIEGKSPLYNAIVRMYHRDGRYIWIKDTGKVIETRNGKATKMLGSHLNITTIKEQEENLRTIKSAADHSPVSIVISTIEDRIVYINPQFTKLTGYTFEEVISKNTSILKSGHHDNDFFKQLWTTILKGDNYTTELYNRKKSGECFWCATSISPVFNRQNQITHFVAIMTDITQRKSDDEYIKSCRQKLEAEINDKIIEIEDSQKAAIIAMSRITEARDEYTGKHVERVQHLCKALTISLKNTDNFRDVITTEFINDMFYASALHDIGKVRVLDEILLKTDKLTKEEFDKIKMHVAYGAQILAEMVRYYPRSNLILLGKEIAKYHHERYDGSGYLEGLVGNEIPLSARIMAIVDVYDALRSKRPYKEALSHRKAREIVLSEAGRHFDPSIIDSFDKIHSQFETIYESLEK